MFFQILKNISSENKTPKINHGLALAVLFIQLAKADDDYSYNEYELILKILENRYKITRKEAEEILSQADDLEKNTSDTMQITREIKNFVPYEERSDILRDLWEITMSDSKRSNEENNFIRLVTKLLGMSDKLSAQIRIEVLDAIENDDTAK